MLPIVPWMLALGSLSAPPDSFALRLAGMEQETPSSEDGTKSVPRWIDPQDGWFDLSSFLEHPHGFVPLVVPITEPAVGYGAVGALVFMHPRKEAGEEGFAFPDITAVGGLWTEDGSDGVFAANMTRWEGGLQTLVAAGKLNLDLDLYGIGKDETLDDDPLEYDLDMTGVVAEGRKQLGESDFWGQLRFAYADVEVDFGGPSTGIEGVGPDDGDTTIAGPTVGLRYDSFDNMFTPTRGFLSETTASFFDEVFGSSQDYQLLYQLLIHRTPLSEVLFLGTRVDGKFSFGDVPFYARPYIWLRGVPALRYQGESAVSAEVELRWQFHRRFSLVGFGGGGVAWTDFDGFERDQDAFAGGAGFRYLVARKFGLHMGLDVAQGPEETVIYVQFGNAWLRP